LGVNRVDHAILFAMLAPAAYWPFVAAGAGVVTVLGLMIGFRCSAFIALLAAALVVAVLSGIGGTDPMAEVVAALGSTAGGIAVVIAMAAVIGKCMLDSGSAERIVNVALRFTGEKRAPVGLMASGFVLAVPVFFDTVFYLLVPLARSLYQKTRKHYVLYVMAVACGGAITHTLVPPTPGPLLVAANLGVDVGDVMLVGILVALPAALIGLAFCRFMDARIQVPMRPVGGVRTDSPANDAEDARQAGQPLRQVPLWLALAPVVLPVVLITASTIATTVADREDAARLQAADVSDWARLQDRILQEATADTPNPAARILGSSKLSAAQRAALQDSTAPEEAWLPALNAVLLDKQLFDSRAFRQVEMSDRLRGKLAADQLRTKPVDMRRWNRELLVATYPEHVAPAKWDTPRRRWSDVLSGFGNASVALSLAALVAIGTLAWARRRSLQALGGDVEEALMSGGLIILITAAGGAFGVMLQKTGISQAIESTLGAQGVSGQWVLLLGFGIAAILKIAQGSSTVAMIIGSSMVAAMVNLESLNYHPAYLVTAIGGGSLIGSWMNDSGFWVFAKMGGLTEAESLKTWTPLLIVLGTSSLLVSLLLSIVLPMR
jgi:gluconate:H+ symporter, GntP family